MRCICWLAPKLETNNTWHLTYWWTHINWSQTKYSTANRAKRQPYRRKTEDDIHLKSNHASHQHWSKQYWYHIGEKSDTTFGVTPYHNQHHKSLPSSTIRDKPSHLFCFVSGIVHLLLHSLHIFIIILPALIGRYYGGVSAVSGGPVEDVGLLEYLGVKRTFWNT